MTGSDVLPGDFDAAQLLHIAGRIGTPTYVYTQRRIERQVESLREAVHGVPGRFLYAMKANSHPAVLATLREQGVGIDAVSPAELLLALRLGFAPEKILFSANNMSDAEMQFAHHQGVLLNIGELTRLERFAQAFPGARVCVRINPQVGAGHHEHVITAGSLSKFGIPVQQLDAARRIMENGGLRLVGLHQHIGSGVVDADTFWEAIRVLLQAAAAFPDLAFVNVGGGLGIPYAPGEQGLDLERIRSDVAPRLARFAADRRLEVWFEPGRFFVAQSAVLLARVTTVKDNGDRVFAGLDTGMNHLIRPALYGSYHGVVNVSNPDDAVAAYDIVGNICETGDTFARARPVSRIREGDVLALLDTGAYGNAMASRYNLRGRPAEVWVGTEEGRYELISHRLSAAEIVQRELAEGRVPAGLAGG